VSDVLARVGILGSLPTDVLIRLAEVGERRLFRAGDVLLRQGEPSTSLHIIVAGQVQVERERADGTSLVLSAFGPGEVVGEMGLLDDAPRSATVIATADTETLEFGLAPIATLMAQYPVLARVVLRSLIQRLRRMTTLAGAGAGSGASAQEFLVDALIAVRDDGARLDGVLLAARTMEHYVNNRLTLTVGFAELIALHPRLPSELREWAQMALTGAQDAAALIQKLGRVTRLYESAGSGGTILDLERSAPPSEPAGP